MSSFLSTETDPSTGSTSCLLTLPIPLSSAESGKCTPQYYLMRSCPGRLGRKWSVDGKCSVDRERSDMIVQHGALRLLTTRSLRGYPDTGAGSSTTGQGGSTMTKGLYEVDRKAEYEAQLKARQFRAGRDDPSSKVHTNATALGNTLLDHIQAEFPIKTDKIRGLFIEKLAELYSEAGKSDPENPMRLTVSQVELTE